MTNRASIDAAFRAAVVGGVIGFWLCALRIRCFLAGVVFSLTFSLLGWFRYKESKSARLSQKEQLAGSFAAGFLIAMLPGIAVWTVLDRWSRFDLPTMLKEFIVGAIASAVIEAFLLVAGLVSYRSLPVAEELPVTEPAESSGQITS